MLTVCCCTVAAAGFAAAAHPESAVSADEALARLKEGNERFASGKAEHPNADAARRKETNDEGQHPFVTVVACSDSRIPVEILFDQGIGDVFVVRVAGNVCNGDEIGCVEYGVEHLGTSLCVVLGHTKCGAVTGVATNARLEGHLARLVGNIRHAVARTRREHPDLEGQDFIEAVVRANVEQSIQDLIQGSRTMRERVDSGRLLVVGAIYDLESGRVSWLGANNPQH